MVDCPKGWTGIEEEREGTQKGERNSKGREMGIGREGGELLGGRIL